MEISSKAKRNGLFIAALFLFLNLSLLKSETLTHTSASDFNAGTYSGTGISIGEDGSLRLSYSVSDTIPEYRIGSGLPLKNLGMSIWNRRIYVSGGIDKENSVQSAVFSAPVNSDGSVGPWKSENPLPEPRAHHTMSILNGQLYVIGGSDSSNKAQNSVFRAPLSFSGELGSWNNEPSLPEPRWRHAATVVGDRIFVSGGHDSYTIPQDMIYSARANADGTLSSWKIEGKRLPNRLYYHSMIEMNNQLFIIGGKDGNNAQSAVYSISLDLKGLAGDWKSENPLPFPIYAHESVILGDSIFNIGGRDSNNRTLADISHANIKKVGSLTKWQSSVYNLQTPLVFHRSAALDNRIYTVGGLEETGDLSENWISIGTNNDFHYGEWKSSVNNLPYGLYAAASAIWNGKIYLIGGYNETNGVSNRVFRASINSNGTIGVLEEEQSSFPEPRQGAKTVVWRNRIYVVGGENENNKPSAVYSASINSNGTLGAWRKETELPTHTYTRSASYESLESKPQPLAPPPPCCYSFTATGRTEFAISIRNGRIYISGGSDSGGGGGNEVLSSQIDSDGRLSEWRYESPLPESVRVHGMAAVNGKFYIVQGYTEKPVYSCSINPDGTLTSWSVLNSGLPGMTFPVSLLSVNGKLHTFGGYPPNTKNFSNPGVARVNFTASMNEDGSMGSWKEEPNLLPSMIPDPGFFHWKGKFYIVGGGGYANPFYIYTSGTPLYSRKGTYLSPITDLGSVRRLDKFSWTQSANPTGSNLSVSYRVAESTSAPMGEFKTVLNGESLKSAYGRFVQYKIEMTAGGNINSSYQDQTPVIEDISITHLEDPTPPVLQSYSVDSNSLSLNIENPNLDAIEISTSNFSNSNSGSGTKFSISGLISNTSYTVYSRKTNHDRRISKEVILLSTYTLSAPPINISADEVKLDSLKFSWDTNGNPSSTTYLAKLYLGMKSELIEQKSSNSNSVSFNNLSIGTKYTIYLYARNVDGSLGKEMSFSTKTKELNPANMNVKIATGSYTLEWSSQPEGEGYRILDISNKLIADLPQNATYFFESGLKENEKVERRIEFYTQSISSAIANVSFYTAVSPPSNTEDAVSILEKGATFIRMRVNPPPNPVGKAGVRVRVIPTTTNFSIPNTYLSKALSAGAALEIKGAKTVDFTDGLWEQTVNGLTPNLRYSLLTSYINADGVESPPSSSAMALALGFSPLEENIKPESDRFFVNDGLNFQVSSNKSGEGTIKIYDVNQNLVRSIPFSYGSGNTTVKWDGKDDLGQQVFSGVYWIVIDSSQFGSKTVYVGAVR